MPYTSKRQRERGKQQQEKERDKEACSSKRQRGDRERGSLSVCFSYRSPSRRHKTPVSEEISLRIRPTARPRPQRAALGSGSCRESSLRRHKETTYHETGKETSSREETSGILNRMRRERERGRAGKETAARIL